MNKTEKSFSSLGCTINDQSYRFLIFCKVGSCLAYDFVGLAKSYNCEQFQSMTLLSELQILLKITTTTDKQQQQNDGLMRLSHSLKILNYLLWTKYPFRLVWKGNSIFFATINLSCLLSTWISFDLREKDASKTGERGFRRLP